MAQLVVTEQSDLHENFEDMCHNTPDKKEVLMAIARKRSASKLFGYTSVKRLMDIVISSLALLVISPLIIIVTAMIKVTSRGPVFYISKRVGQGYQIFNLYKFRTMHVDADRALQSVSHKNVYRSTDGTSAPPTQCPECTRLNRPCSPLLLNDNDFICENRYLQQQSDKKNGVFVKIQNDPRVYALGTFLRKTSVDELPQLLNVLKGEMSLVGNRPLPLYEAEQLTTDEWAERFLAPAGLTGLWQVTKRGQAGITQEERIDLDNQYVRIRSFRTDIKIIIKTFPALLQQTNV